MSVSDFLFSTPTALFSRSDLVISGTFASFLIIAVAAKAGQLMQTKKNAVVSRLLRRVSFGLFSFGISGAIWIALRYLSIPYLGIRFVAAAIALGFLVWLYFMLAYTLFRFPREKAVWQNNQVKQKYLKG
ncbi:MAG: hypothetical protein M1275_02295 [Patescibacteria group bacterium]|nr:hypothetical protein [Patescibacteria group bacterium]